MKVSFNISDMVMMQRLKKQWKRQEKIVWHYLSLGVGSLGSSLEWTRRKKKNRFFKRRIKRHSDILDAVYGREREEWKETLWFEFRDLEIWELLYTILSRKDRQFGERDWVHLVSTEFTCYPQCSSIYTIAGWE